MAEYEKKVRKILAQNGCTFERHGKGEHDIGYNKIQKGRTGTHLFPVKSA